MTYLLNGLKVTVAVLNKVKSIEKELHEVLSKWLINHIQHDDADYVGAVKLNMMGIIKENEKKKGKNWFARFFS